MLVPFETYASSSQSSSISLVDSSYYHKYNVQQDFMESMEKLHCKYDFMKSMEKLFFKILGLFV